MIVGRAVEVTVASMEARTMTRRRAAVVHQREPSGRGGVVAGAGAGGDAEEERGRGADEGTGDGEGAVGEAVVGDAHRHEVEVEAEDPGAGDQEEGKRRGGKFNGDVGIVGGGGEPGDGDVRDAKKV